MITPDILDIGGIYRDICRGYSEITLASAGKKVYLKHFSSVDFALIDNYSFLETERYKVKGALSREALEAKLVIDGVWQADKDKRLEYLKRNIQTMVEAKQKAAIAAQIVEQERIIKEYEDEYVKISREKDQILGLSAESLAASASLEYTLYLSLFKDSGLSVSLFELEEIVDFDDQELFNILVPYRAKSDLFNGKSLKKISVNHKIGNFIKNSQNAESFFGRSGMNLTYYQVLLFDFGKYFLSLMPSIPDLTMEEREDPDEIERLFLIENNKDKSKPESNLLTTFAKAKKG